MGGMGMYVIAVTVVYFAMLVLVSRLAGGDGGNGAFFRANRCAPWPMVAFGMIGASLSGVSFVSVPGMVGHSGFAYLQMCMGFFFGYLFIAHVLLPLYYKRNYLSIYRFLNDRMGRRSYRTASLFFLVSKLTGAAAKLYVVCLLLQRFAADAVDVPFVVTVFAVVAMIWLYTRSGGMRTIVWTDVVQTFFLLAALLLITWQVMRLLHVDLDGVWSLVCSAGYGRVFVFDDIASGDNFFRYFVSGVFVTIAMTGLDQDAMQKNLACRSLRSAQRGMYCYGFSFLPVNFLFLLLGALLLVYADRYGIAVPREGDALLPSMVASGALGTTAAVCFVVGIVAAAFSSADSALTALTTGVCVDFLDISRLAPAAACRMRKAVHVAVSLLSVVCILLFHAFNDRGLLDAVYMLVGYTYGPLLGLYAIGLFTRVRVRDGAVPYICVASPLLCLLLQRVSEHCWGYSPGYEILIINGALTFAGVWAASAVRR